MPPKQQSKATRGTAAAKSKASLSFDEDLDALFAEALQATERRAAGAAWTRREPDLLDEPDEVDQSIHILVDEDAIGLDSFGDPDEDETQPGGGPEFAIEDLEFLRSLRDEPGSPPPARPVTDRSLDDLDRELRKAVAEEDEPDEDDLQREMERLLAESFGTGESDVDGLPDLDDDDEEILAVGDDGAQVLSRAADAELERLRSQVAELSRALSMRDIELRTAEDRVETLESQLVATARQSANVGREFESFRRRADREKGDMERFAGEKVIKEFLGVYDNLERALAHAGDQRGTALAQGVEMILGQFMGALKRCGVERVDASAGTPFDPAFHEAVGQEPSDGIDAGAIVSEMQAGFVLGGRLVRAAMVSVSQGPLTPAAPAASATPAAAPAEGEPGADGEIAEKPRPKPKSAKAKPKSKARAPRGKARPGDGGEEPTDAPGHGDRPGDDDPTGG